MPSFRDRLLELAAEHERLQARLEELSHQPDRVKRASTLSKGSLKADSSGRSLLAHTRSERRVSESEDLHLAMPRDLYDDVPNEATASSIPAATVTEAAGGADMSGTPAPMIAHSSTVVSVDEEEHERRSRKAGKPVLSWAEDSNNGSSRSEGGGVTTGSEVDRKRGLLERGGSFASSLGIRKSGSRPSETKSELGSFISRAALNIQGWSAFPDALEKATNAAIADRDELKKGRCVLSPFSRTRLTWDLIIFASLFFEFWVTPFELVFVPDDQVPRVMRVFSHCITGLFAFDIILNFNTGYIHKDHTVMDRRQIARTYLSLWFWCDFISTVPADLIFSTIGGSFLRWVRFGKVLRLLRTLRYIKLVRSVQLLATMQRASYFTELMVGLRYFSLPAQCLLALAVFAHVHGTIWAALRIDFVPADTVSQAFRLYYESFWWAFTAIAVGELGKHPNHGSPGVWTLEMIVAAERLFMVALGAIWAVFESQVRLQDYGRLAQLKEHALAYLKRHQVSIATQIQVLYILHETGRARDRQRHFRELMDNDLPLELHRKICCELWSARLMSLELIMHVAQMQDFFIVELSMSVREEVLASKAVLFRLGDSSIAAYCIIDGGLVMVATPGNTPVPEFTVGNWVGETALVNPGLCRTMTLVTKRITALMAIPADQFHELLSSSGLVDKYQTLCAEYIWRGLCARCGLLGDHFTNDCPTLNRTTRRTAYSNNGAVEVPKKRISVWQGFGKQSSNPDRESITVHADLEQFLKDRQLSYLTQVLVELGITSLDDLEKMADQLGGVLPEELQLSQDEFAALSCDSISRFRIDAKRAVQKHLLNTEAMPDTHYVFLSHSKLEAGTEATLMRTELEHLIAETEKTAKSRFKVPIFLDSENLTCLEDLQATVAKTHNLALLLTPGVLTRPWVLVEIVTAVKAGVRILPVQVSKPGSTFEYPNQDFYDRLYNGDLLTWDGAQVLRQAEISFREVEAALREVFHQIAVPYSPHRSAEIRKAELQALLKRCGLRHDLAGTGRSSSPMGMDPRGSLGVASFAPIKVTDS